MMIGYHTINFMNAVNKGKVSFLLAILRHVIILIPAMIIMNSLWGLTGLVWSQVVADVINAAASVVIFVKVKRQSLKLATHA